MAEAAVEPMGAPLTPIDEVPMSPFKKKMALLVDDVSLHPSSPAIYTYELVLNVLLEAWNACHPGPLTVHFLAILLV